MKFKKIKNIIISTVTVVTLLSSDMFYVSAIEFSTKNENVIQSEEQVLSADLKDNCRISYGLKGASELKEDKQFSWDNASVYFAITDRFNNGDTSNDHSYGRSKGEIGADNYQNRQGTFHGGDLKGLTNKLNEGYFDDLGVNAIWITAPYEQIHGALSSNGFKHYAYHGYYTLDYTNVDDNMGTAKDLENFIDTAHSHGIRVVFDVVMNHAGYADPVTANEYGFGGLSSNWRNIYYSWDESRYQWFNDYAWEASKNGSEGMMIPNGDWISNWWGTDWIRAIGSRFNGYEGDENGPNEKVQCLNGLPDFKTESGENVQIPGILRNKWEKEGRYDKEMNELNNFFNSTGRSRKVSNYLVKWLTDWVREYGVDGFRCDTAKHVDVSCWKDLKDESKKALKEWRKNNPNKPGAKWNDEFWMTGEHFDHGVYKDNYFTSGAFDSMINFKYKDEGHVFKPSTEIEGTFADYANKINSDDSFNMLSYISSHDKGLSRGNMITAGNNLLLLPGGIQIFYGDETNRQAVGSNEEQSWRSQMNWGSMDRRELKHWQKLGQFRNNHISIGAGSHTKISSSPYTFSRVYNKKGVSDKVIVSLTNTVGSKTISVGNVFNNGDTVRDYYTGREYTVSNGMVQVNAGENGVVLLEESKSTPKVSLNSETTEYSTDSLTVILNSSNCASAKYSVNGGKYIAYSDGDKIEISGKNVGEKTTIKVVGFDENGKEVSNETKVFTKVPFRKGLTVHVKNKNWNEAPNIYAYNEENGNVELYSSSWPGTKMVSEGDGWYSYTIKNKEKARVIFNGSWGQYPGVGEPGMEVSSDVWLLDGKIVDKKDEPINEELIVHVKNDSWYIAPNIYIYNEENGRVQLYSGSWPGTKMIPEGNGWYSYRVKKVSSAKIIFNGMWGQYPYTGQPGMDASGEVWIYNNKFINPIR